MRERENEREFGRRERDLKRERGGAIVRRWRNSPEKWRRGKKRKKNKKIKILIYYYYYIGPKFDQLRTVSKNYKK